MRLINILFFCLAVGFVSCTSKPKPAPEGKITTVLPFEIFDNRIVVDVFIDSQGPFKFFFESGSTNFITPAIVKKLNLVAKKSEDGGGEAESFPMERANIKLLKIGDIRVVDQEVSVIDLSKAQKALQMPDIAGAFGYEVLLHYVASVDYDKKQLTLTNDVSSLDLKGFVKFPIKVVAETPVIDIKIQGIPAKVFVDNGDRSALTVLMGFREKHAKVAKVFAKSKLHITGFGAGGPIRGKVGTIASLDIAPGISLKKVSARSPTKLNGYAPINEMDASIGSQILRQFHTVFDLTNRFLYLKPNSTFGTPTRFEKVPNPELK